MSELATLLVADGAAVTFIVGDAADVPPSLDVVADVQARVGLDVHGVTLESTRTSTPLPRRLLRLTSSSPAATTSSSPACSPTAR